MIDRRLPNGLRILLLPDAAAACVNLVLAVAAGSIHDTDHPGCGCAHWVEHLLFDGCKGFPGDSVIREVSRLGGSFNAMTGLYRTEYTLSVCPRDTGRALEILGAMLTAPDFLPAQIEHERSVIAREIDLYADDSEAALDELLYAAVYAGTPLAEPVAGRKELFLSAPASLPEEYFRSRYSPGSMVLAAAGPVDEKKFLDDACKYLSSISGKGEYLRSWEFPEQEAPRRMVKKFPDPDTAKIAAGFPFTGSSRREFWTGSILASLLAWNDSSFLEREFCRKRCLARDIASSLDGEGAWGIFRVEADCDPGKTAELEAALADAVCSFDAGCITSDALEAEKLQCTAMLRSEFRDPAMLAGRIAERATVPEREISPDPAADEKIIRDITVGDIRDFAEKYLRHEHLSTVILANDLRKTKQRKLRHRKDSGYFEPARLPVPPAPGLLRAAPAADIPIRRVFVPDKSGITDISILLPCAGSREAAFGNGISQLACKVLEAGPGKYSEEEWLSRLDACAVNLDAEFTSSALRLEISVPSENQAAAMEYILELLAAPAWRRSVIRREAGSLAGEWLSMSSSGTKVFDRARKLLFGDHPAGLPAGDPEGIHSIGSRKLKDFYRGLWIPGGVTAGFGGTYSPELAESFLAALARLMPWHDGTMPGDSIWQRPENDHYDEVTLDREQCVCVCMMPAPSLNETEALAAFKILDYAEGGLSGQLFQLIREKHHLAYSVETGIAPGFGCGAMYFSAGCEFAEGEKVTELFAEEVDNIAAGGISRELFEKARAEERVVRKMNESNRITLCSRRTLAEFCGTSRLGDAIDAMTYGKFMDTVTGALASVKKVFVRAKEEK